MRKYYYTILIMACLSCVETMAQTAKDSMIQRDLLLEKDYIPQLETAGKIYSSPELEPFKAEKTQVQFATSQFSSSISSDYVPLRAAQAPADYPSQQQKGYLRLGIGNHYALMGDAQWNILRQSRQVLDLNLWHRSQAVPDSSTRVDNDSRIQLNYKLHLESIELKASLSERLFAWNYYAPEDWTMIDLTNRLEYPRKQQSSDSKLSLSLQSKSWDKDFNYAFSVDGHLFKLRSAPSLLNVLDGVSEKEIDANGEVSYQINDNWKASLGARMRLLGYDNVQNVTRINTTSAYGDSIDRRLWFEIHPKVSYHLDLWDLSLGVRLSAGSGQSLKLAPTAFVSRPLGQQADFGVEIEGGQIIKSYREGLSINPYLDPSIRLLPEYSPFGIHAFLEWKPFEGMNVVPQVGYRVVNEMPMFFNAVPLPSPPAPDLYQFFSVEYASVNSFYAGCRMAYTYKELVHFNADFKYNYDRAFRSSSESFHQTLKDNQGKVWYKPAMELNASMEVNPTDRVALSVAYRWEGGRYASTKQSSFERLDDLHFLTAMGSYRITPRWGAFIQVRNILNRPYQRWNNYSNYGITGLVGASYSF